MSLSEPSAPLSSRLATLLGRLGMAGRQARHILQRASQLQLPFQTLPGHPDSISWQAGPPLQRLADLPRSALSGPVQEDKAAAHAALSRIVTLQQYSLDEVDLRHIDGINAAESAYLQARSFEDYLASKPQRNVRIISYKDFLRAVCLPLPHFLQGEPIQLLRADWRGERLFWAGEQQLEAFISAVAYARRRELPVLLPARLAHYHIDDLALEQLQLHYHMLAMPAQAWSDPAFMGLLLDTGLPYARLSLRDASGGPEALLLPRNQPLANALGEGLRLAGAADVVEHLHRLKRSI